LVCQLVEHNKIPRIKFSKNTDKAKYQPRRAFKEYGLKTRKLLNPTLSLWKDGKLMKIFSVIVRILSQDLEGFEENAA
jgi:hypothetical protein